MKLSTAFLLCALALAARLLLPQLAAEARTVFFGEAGISGVCEVFAPDG